MAPERAPEDRPGLPVRGREGDHHEVQPREPSLTLPEALAHQPLHAVAPVRTADALLRHREPKPRRDGARRSGPGSGEDREVTVGGADRIFEYPLEVVLRTEPPVAPERAVALQRQPLTKRGAPGPWLAAP